MEARGRFNRDTAEAQRARRFVSQRLAEWAVPADASLVALVVSELVTNAILHGSGEIELTVRTAADHVHIEVSDQGSATRPVLRSVTEETAGGRGLLVVDQLSERWGHGRTPAGGTTVWADLRTGEPAIWLS